MNNIMTLVCLISFVVTISGQPLDIKNFDYSKVDSIAVNFPKSKYKSTHKLARLLTRDLFTEHEKFRVLFRWVTENIEYRYGYHGKEPDQVLKRKKAVCEGYASLLKELCSAVGIECPIVIGYSKSLPEKDIYTKMKKANHAWNAVRLNGKWYLVDATWAAGGYDHKKRKFYKNYEENFFLADPNFFILGHFPLEEDWRLTDTVYNKSYFKRSPIYYTNYSNMGVKLKNSIKAKVGREIKLDFTSTTPVHLVTLRFETETTNRILDLKKTDDNYEVTYRFGNNDEGVFHVFLNEKPILGLMKK